MRIDLLNRFLPWLAAFVLALAAPVATAQLGPVAQVSIESRVARADRVVRARIADIQRLPGEGDMHWQQVTLRVAETIKGEPAEELTFFHQTDGSFDRYRPIMDAEHAYMWFLVSPQRFETGGRGRIADDFPEQATLLPVTGGEIPLGRPIELDRGWKPPDPAVSMDLTTPRTPDAILRKARDAAAHEREHGEPTAHYPIDIAGLDPARVTTISPDGNSVLMPVDARLERIAHQLVATPEAFAAPLASSADDEAQRRHAWATTALRRQGLSILAMHFPTETNAPLFEPMLVSEHVVIHHGAGPGEPARITYPMRALAYEALTGMGRSITKPVLEAPLVDASLAPTPAAVHAVHGPRLEGLVSTEFLIELGGDQTPELLRLTYLEAKGSAMARDLDDFRTGMTNPYAFTLFAFAEGVAVPVFHAGSDNDGIELQLRDFDGTPALVYQIHTKDPNVYACGWWDFFEPGAVKGWQTRRGHWKGDGRSIEFTGYGPLIWYGFSK